MVLFQDIRVDCPHPFALLTGGDDLYLPSLALGGGWRYFRPVLQ